MHTLEVPPEDEVVSAWESTDAIDREPFIVLAKNEQDPRVHHDKFRLARPMVDFASTRVSPEQFYDLGTFVCGCRVSDINLRAGMFWTFT